MMKNSTAICVLGMHRSGTSLMSGILNKLGVYFGKNEDLIPPRKDNPEGFWELSEIVSFHEDLLKELSSNTNSTIPLQDINFENKILQPYKKRLKEIINKHFSGQSLWGWKDPRTCVFLPLWLEVLYEMDIDIKFIIQFRNPVDVAKSLEKRNGLPKNRAYRSWYLHNLQALKWSSNYKRISVNYDTLLADWELVISNVSKFLNVTSLEDDPELKHLINSFIRKDLRHSHSNYTDIIQMTPEKIINLYDKLLETEKDNKILEQDEFLSYINRELDNYEKYTRLFIDELEYETSQDFFAIEIFETCETNDGLNFDKYLDSVGVICDGTIREYTMEVPFINPRYLRLDPVNFPAIIDIYSIELYKKDGKNNNKVYEWSKNNNYRGVELHDQLIRVYSNDHLKLLATGGNPIIHLHHDIERSNEQYLLKITMSVSKPFNDISKQIEYLEIIYNKLKTAEDFIGDILVRNVQERPVFIWGTGVGGKITLDLLKNKSKRILGFIDNDSNKWGSLFCGYKVFSPNEILENYYSNTKPYVIIGSMYYEDICKQIRDFGFNEIEDYCVNFYL